MRAISNVGPISRILYGVAAVTVIPLGRPLLDGSSDLPGSLAPRAETHGFFSRAPQRLAPASPSRSVRAERLSPPAHPVHRHSSPIWSCSVWGLPCPVHCCPGGALLPHLFTLTCGLRLRRYLLCGTFRRMALKPPSRTLSGTLLCGVRTFLSLGSSPGKPRRPQPRQRPSGPTSTTPIIR